MFCHMPGSKNQGKRVIRSATQDAKQLRVARAANQRVRNSIFTLAHRELRKAWEVLRGRSVPGSRGTGEQSQRLHVWRGRSTVDAEGRLEKHVSAIYSDDCFTLRFCLALTSRHLKKRSRYTCMADARPTSRFETLSIPTQSQTPVVLCKHQATCEICRYLCSGMD